MTGALRALAGLLTVALMALVPAAAAARARDYQIGSLKLSQLWSRLPPAGSKVAGGFLSIANTGSEADTLIGGSTEISRAVEIHETVVENGRTRMRALRPGLVIKPGETVVLEPNALHLMFVDVVRPLEFGKTLKVSLFFERAGTIDVDLVIETYGATGPGDAHSAHARTPGATATQPLLVDSHNRAFDLDRLAGKPYAITFGYTHCPDICPTLLLEMSNRLAALGDQAERLQVIFVSVDHERDDAAHMKEYLTAFDPRIIGLSGTKEAVASAAEQYGVYYKRHTAGDGRSTFDHSAGVFLFTAAGDLVGVLGPNDDEALQLAKLRWLLQLPSE